MTLDAYLKANELTEQAFAERIGATQSYVHRIRKGQVFKLSLDVAIRIHQASDEQIGLLELLPRTRK